MTAELVVGVDVGSQGTCAQAHRRRRRAGRDGLRAPHALVPAARLGRAGRARVAGRRRAGAGRGAPGGRQRAQSARVSFGSQLDGLVAADATGEPLGPALIWMDRRAATKCAAAAERIDPERLTRAERLQPRPGPRGREDRLARASTERPSIRAGALVPAARLLRRLAASGELAVDPSNASSSMLLDVRSRDWSAGGLRGLRHRPRVARAVRPAHARAGPRGAVAARGGRADASTQVVLGCGDEMAATLGAGVVEPGAVCDVMGTAEPVCAVMPGPAFDPDGHHRAAPARRPRRLAARESRAGSPAARTAGSATSWARSRRSRGRPPAPTCTSC